MVEEGVQKRQPIPQENPGSNEQLLSPERKISKDEFAKRRISMLAELSGGSVSSFDKMDGEDQTFEDIHHHIDKNQHNYFGVKSIN